VREWSWRQEFIQYKLNNHDKTSENMSHEDPEICVMEYIGGKIGRDDVSKRLDIGTMVGTSEKLEATCRKNDS